MLNVVGACCLLLVALSIAAEASKSRPCNARWQEIVVGSKWGYIYSPNFGYGPYFPADTCFWLFTSSQPNQQIRLIFQSFNLQDRYIECEDYVKVFDGKRESSPLIGTYCGHKPPRAVVSSGESLLVKFRSDDELQSSGFRIIYEPYKKRSRPLRRQLNDAMPKPVDQPSILQSLTCPGETDAVDLLEHVPNKKITASSSWRNHPPWLARLDNTATAMRACCWAAENSADDSAYIQAEFDSRKSVNAIVTQGSDILDEWVTSYRLAYALNGHDFTYYKTYDGKIKVFKANRNPQAKAVSILDPPVVARFIRLIPHTAHRWKTMRWGIYGCNESTSRKHRHRHRRPPPQTTPANYFMALVTTTTKKTAENLLPDPPLIHQIFAEEAPYFSLDTAQQPKNLGGDSRSQRCQGAIRMMTTPRGRIESPNYGAGKSYPSDDSCTWQVFARENQRIKVVFESLDFPETYSCQRDFVALYDGPTVRSLPLGKFCGRNLPPILVTSGNQLTVYFGSRESGENGKGFALNYYFQPLAPEDQNVAVIRATTPLPTVIANSPVKRCDDRILIFNGINGKIESPGYGKSQYSPDDVCNWRIMAPSNRRIRIIFQDFDLSDVRNSENMCLDDYLSLYDGSSDANVLLGMYCGKNMPPNVISSGPSMFIRLTTGAPNSQRRAGIRAVFTTYEDRSQSHHHKVQAVAHEMKDSVKVDGEEAPSKPKEDARCDGQIKIMTHREGVIASPRYATEASYYPNDLCFWLLKAPTGFRIRFFFDIISLEPGQRCLSDNLTIFDGDRDTAPLLGFYCGYETPNEAYLTSGQHLLVRFASGNSETANRRGFRINYRFINQTFEFPNSNYKVNAVSEVVKDIPVVTPTQTPAPAEHVLSSKGYHINGCRGVKNLLTGEKGVVVSPNFGAGPYFPGDTCFWEIRTIPSKRIRLGFQIFKVGWSVNCTKDRLIIYDGSSELSRVLGTFCGQQLPMPVTSTINVLLMKFVTDSKPKAENDMGFMAIYGTLDYLDSKSTTTIKPTLVVPRIPQKTDRACNGSVDVLTQASGVLTSPDFADNVLPAGMMCFWEIRAPPGHQIRLQFETFAMPGTEECVGAHVALFIGSGSARPQIGRFCGDSLPPDTTSPRDRLFIRFVSAPYTVPGGFAAHYTVVGGIPTTPRHSLSPKMTTTTTTTTTTTRAPVTIPSSSVSTTTRPLAVTNKAAPARLIKKCNDGRQVLTDSKGIIRSPNFGDGRRYPKGDSCWWQILLQPGSTIDLKFRSFRIASSQSCLADRLVVIDGPDSRQSPTQSFCGAMPPADFRSSSNIITIHFVSSDLLTKSDSGFELEYFEALPEESTTAVEPTVEELPSPTISNVTTNPNIFTVNGACSGRTYILIYDNDVEPTSSWKRIASPNFANPDHSSYLPGDSCFWKVIGADYSKSIELRIELVDLNSVTGNCEPHAEGDADVLSLFDGADESAPIISRLCGNNVKAGGIYVTSSNQALIEFSSAPVPSSNKPAGFLIAYRAVDKIVSSDTSAPSTNVKSAVQFPVKPYVKSPVGAKYGAVGLPRTLSVTPAGPRQTVPFMMVPEITTRKTRGNFGTILPRCEGRLQIFSQDNGAIESPNFGTSQGYAPGDSCLWEIIGRSGTKVELVFKTFDVGASPSPGYSADEPDRCPTDRVVVYDGPGEYYPVLSTLCGELSAGYRMMTKSNAAFVQFISDTKQPGELHSGFSLEYSVLGGTFFEEDAPITTHHRTVHPPHQVFAEAPAVGNIPLIPLLSDPVVKPLPPGVNTATMKSIKQVTPAWWCDDDLVQMLPDEAISASSHRKMFMPKLARDRRDWTMAAFDLPCCWQPSDNDSNPFVQFDFGGPHMIAAARILDMRPVLQNSSSTPSLYLLVSESFESASDSRVPLKVSKDRESRVTISPPLVASKVRVYLVQQRTAENEVTAPKSDHERPLVRISLFGCAASAFDLDSEE